MGGVFDLCRGVRRVEVVTVLGELHDIGQVHEEIFCAVSEAEGTVVGAPIESFRPLAAVGVRGGLEVVARTKSKTRAQVDFTADADGVASAVFLACERIFVGEIIVVGI